MSNKRVKRSKGPTMVAGIACVVGAVVIFVLSLFAGISMTEQNRPRSTTIAEHCKTHDTWVATDCANAQPSDYTWGVPLFLLLPIILLFTYGLWLIFKPVLAPLFTQLWSTAKSKIKFRKKTP